MTPDALHPPRLPEDFAAAGWPEALAALAIGLLLGLAAHTLLRPVLQRKPRRPTLQSLLAPMQNLPPEDRLLAQLRLLHQLGGQVPEAQRPALYTGNPDLTPLIKAQWRARRA